MFFCHQFYCLNIWSPKRLRVLNEGWKSNIGDVKVFPFESLIIHWAFTDLKLGNIFSNCWTQRWDSGTLYVENSCLAESKSFKAVLLPVSSIWNLTSKLMALFSSCLNPSWSILLVRMTRCLVLIFTMSMKSINKSISLMTLVFAIVSKQVEVVNASRMFSSFSNFNNLLTLLNLRVTWPGATGDRRT